MMKMDKGSQEYAMGAELVLQFRPELTKRVKETRRVAKALLTQGLVATEEYQAVVGGSSSCERMAEIFRVLEAGGTRAMGALYWLLLEHESELMLEMERAQFLSETKEDLLQRLTRPEAVANRLLGEGLLSEEAYFSVSSAKDEEKRAQELWAGLEMGGTTAKDGFYRALLHCQPLLYRELEKERVMRTCRINTGSEESGLERRRMELQKEEKRLQLEREKIKRERHEIECARAEALKVREEIQKETEQLQLLREKLKERTKLEDGGHLII
ncbi:protein enabled homolog [Sardina pilchardus]|uniref:protein enabled homolog n=1 Tax=Sardina pilchardus TaxID=27697 RepID=UPI002E0DEB1C